MDDNTFLRQRAYAIIQAKILEGELRAGALVSELALAQEIGMSRTPVREAIGQLEREGLFNKVPRVGTIVRLPGYQELKDLYEVREALESHAVMVAIDSLTTGDLDTMASSLEEVHQIAREMRRRKIDVLDEELLTRFFSADITFHLTIIRVAANARVLNIVSEFRVIQRVFEYDRMAHDLKIIEGAAVQHGKILETLRNHDGEAARFAMAAHIRASQENALASFDTSLRAIAGDVAPEVMPVPAPKLPSKVLTHDQSTKSKPASKKKKK